MKMTYKKLLTATKSDIETIRMQPSGFNRPPLTTLQVEALRRRIDTLYPFSRAQYEFAHNIYMRAGEGQ